MKILFILARSLPCARSSRFRSRKTWRTSLSATVCRSARTFRASTSARCSWCSQQFPQIRTVYLFGDFPKFDDPLIAGSDDGTNMQPQAGAGPNTPWMAGMFWPYRVTKLTQPFRAQTSGGFEGMAITPDKHRLLPLLEKPLVDDNQQTLLMHEFDLASSSYTGNRFKYQFEPRGVSIGDFILIDEEHGLVIERDNTQGDLNGFKAVYKITLGAPGTFVNKELAVDLLRL